MLLSSMSRVSQESTFKTVLHPKWFLFCLWEGLLEFKTLKTFLGFCRSWVIISWKRVLSGARETIIKEHKMHSRKEKVCSLWDVDGGTHPIHGHETTLWKMHWVTFSACAWEHMCGGLPNDARTRLCFPLFGFLMAISRSCSTCPTRTARSKPIIPDQTLNIWYPQAGWVGITSAQRCPRSELQEKSRHWTLLVFTVSAAV